MINWKEIKDKYQKAFKEFSKWGNHVAVLSRQKQRLLYDFFDENEIYIEIEIDRTLEAKFAPSVYWLEEEMEDLDFDCYQNWTDECLYKTRREAEEAAFIKAFEILENKLRS